MTAAKGHFEQKTPRHCRRRRFFIRVASARARYAPRTSWKISSLGSTVWLLLGIWFALPCTAQTAQLPTVSVRRSVLDSPVDVSIIVMSGATATTQNDAVSYRTEVPRETVVRDIARLCQEFGCRVAGYVHIRDDSLRHNVPSDDPVTTTASFSLEAAPLVVDGSPTLLPFVEGFRAWSHVEVMFNLSDIQPYRGPSDGSNSRLSLRVDHTPGLYTYDVLLKAHELPLPVMGLSAPGTIALPSARATGAQPHSVHWPIFALSAGAVIVCGAVVYLLEGRRTLHR